MRQSLFCALMFLLLIVGCGSDEGSPPVISNIQYSPNWAIIGWGNGTLGIWGSVDFVDPDGDVAYIHLDERECGSGPEKSLDIMLSGVAGRTWGTALFVALVPTNCPAGPYTANVSVF